jgi:hypothetical protein
MGAVMKRTVIAAGALAAAALVPSISSAEWYGASFGKTTVDTGNRNISVHAYRHTSPLIVGIENNSRDYVQCSVRFTHLPVIDETRSARIAPGKTAALVNRQGYLTARIDTQVKCG